MPVAAAKSRPALMSATYAGTPVTRMGIDRVVRVPSPSSLTLWLPQVHTEVTAEMPSVRVATEATYPL